jgi:transmembrane sensor
VSDADQQRIRDEAAQWCARMMRSDADLHRARLDAWLQADDANRDAYERIMRRYNRAGVLAWSSRSRSSGRSPTRRWPVTIGLGIAGVSGGLAAAAMMIMSLSSAMTSVFGTGSPSTGAEGARTAENATYRVGTRVGEIRSITLPDGSRVVLDTRAQLAVAFGADERHLTLRRGRARFEVAHETRPFVVAAGNGEITARGTIFDVEAGDRGWVQVTLLRGAVDVSVRDGAHGARVVKRLQVNQETTFNPAGFTVPVQPTRADIAEWPSGVLDVDAVP